MARQIVHDDNVTRAQLGHQHLGDIGFEPVAIDRPVLHHRCDHPGDPQSCDQRGGLAVAVREAHSQPLAFLTATMAAAHVGRGPGLVDEQEPFPPQIELAVEPVAALLQDVGAVLFDCMASLFLRVMPLRTKKR